MHRVSSVHALFDESGFSLLQTMLAIPIVSIVLFSLNQGIVNLNKAAAGVDWTQSASSVQNRIEKILQLNSTCELNFVGKTINASSFNVPQLGDFAPGQFSLHAPGPNGNPGEVLAKKGETVDGVKIEKLDLVLTGKSKKTFFADINVTFSKPKSIKAIGTSIKQKTFKVTFDANHAAGITVINACTYSPNTERHKVPLGELANYHKGVPDECDWGHFKVGTSQGLSSASFRFCNKGCKGVNLPQGCQGVFPGKGYVSATVDECGGGVSTPGDPSDDWVGITCIR